MKPFRAELVGGPMCGKHLVAHHDQLHFAIYKSTACMLETMRNLSQPPDTVDRITYRLRYCKGVPQQTEEGWFLMDYANS